MLEHINLNTYTSESICIAVARVQKVWMFLAYLVLQADTCIIYDSDWNPQNDLQAMARCHRWFLIPIQHFSTLSAIIQIPVLCINWKILSLYTDGRRYLYQVLLFQGYTYKTSVPWKFHLCRIGQTKDVKIYRLITRNTYEQRLFECSSRKYGLDEAILGNRMGVDISQDHNKKIESLLKHGAYDLLKVCRIW